MANHNQAIVFCSSPLKMKNKRRNWSLSKRNLTNPQICAFPQLLSLCYTWALHVPAKEFLLQGELVMLYFETGAQFWFTVVHLCHTGAGHRAHSCLPVAFVLRGHWNSFSPTLPWVSIWSTETSQKKKKRECTLKLFELLGIWWAFCSSSDLITFWKYLSPDSQIRGLLGSRNYDLLSLISLLVNAEKQKS